MEGSDVDCITLDLASRTLGHSALQYNGPSGENRTPVVLLPKQAADHWPTLGWSPVEGFAHPSSQQLDTTGAFGGE